MLSWSLEQERSPGSSSCSELQGGVLISALCSICRHA